MRGRPKKPDTLKKLAGNPGKRKQDDNKNRPAPEPLKKPPPPPRTLDKLGKKEWKRLAPDLIKHNLLTALDLNILTIYCQAFSRWLMATQEIEKHGHIVKANNGYPVPSPWLGISNAASRVMTDTGVKLGLDPASRSRIDVPKPKEKSALDQWLEQGSKPVLVKK